MGRFDQSEGRRLALLVEEAVLRGYTEAQTIVQLEGEYSRKPVVREYRLAETRIWSAFREAVGERGAKYLTLFRMTLMLWGEANRKGDLKTAASLLREFRGLVETQASAALHQINIGFAGTAPALERRAETKLEIARALEEAGVEVPGHFLEAPAAGEPEPVLVIAKEEAKTLIDRTRRPALAVGDE